MRNFHLHMCINTIRGKNLRAFLKWLSYLCCIVGTFLCLPSCRYYRNISSDQSISYLVGKKLELQEDVFVRAVTGGGKIDYKLNILLGGSHLPKSIEAYEKYGADWYKYDEEFQEMYREDRHERPDKVVGVLKKGTILTIKKIEKHGGYNYGPIIFIYFDADNPLFKNKRVCLDIIMYSAREENNAYNIRFRPQYLKLIN